MLRLLGTTLVLLATACACAGTSTQQVSVEAETTIATSSSTTTTSPPDCASTLPTAAKASQLLMVMVDDPTHAADALAAGEVGGFGLKGNQRSDVADAIAGVVEGTPLPATVAVDEEGGPVQRLRYSAGRIPSAEEMSEGSVEDAAATVADHAQRMAEIGVTMNFAPVADLRNDAVLEGRTFSDDPEVVAGYAEALAAAYTGAGITPVVKHWPGIGGTDTDPHEALPVLAGIDELRARDMVAFEDVIDEPGVAVMVAHAEVPGLTQGGQPASLSREAITGELRGSGFDGVVVTDSLGMGAVVNGRSQAEAAVAAVAAGADIALLSGADVVAGAHDRMTAAIEDGEIDESQVDESVRRVLAMKGIEGECFDAISAYGAIGRTEAEQDQQDQQPEQEQQGGDGTTDEDPEAISGTDGAEVTDSGINDPVSEGGGTAD